jgi:hypothetical protein
MFTRELALDMISRAKTGFDMLTVADAIVGTVEQEQEVNPQAPIGDEGFNYLPDEAFTSIEEDVNPLEDFNNVGSVHHY